MLHPLYFCFVFATTLQILLVETSSRRRGVKGGKRTLHEDMMYEVFLSPQSCCGYFKTNHNYTSPCCTNYKDLGKNNLWPLASLFFVYPSRAQRELYDDLWVVVGIGDPSYCSYFTVIFSTKKAATNRNQNIMQMSNISRSNRHIHFMWHYQLHPPHS